jgi:ribosomal protein S18 acetylase RimI-like enzyme
MIERIQAYLRTSAAQRYESVIIPPFVAYFHPFDSFQFFNYAIPSEPIQGDVQPALKALVAEFLERGRIPRFEYIEEYAPALADELRKARFAAEGRQQLMVCTPESLRTPRSVEGLTITPLTAESPLEDGIDFLTAQRQGFDPEHPSVANQEEAERFLQQTHQLISFLGRLEGTPAGVATYTFPLEGVTEIVGVATVEKFRRRGVATNLTAAAVSSAFASDATLACLTAADRRAGQIYEQVGFRPYATSLSYYLPAA